MATSLAEIRAKLQAAEIAAKQPELLNKIFSLADNLLKEHEASTMSVYRDMSFSINRIFASSGYPRPQRTARQIACARHVLPQNRQQTTSELTGFVKRMRPHIEHRFLKRR